MSALAVSSTIYLLVIFFYASGPDPAAKPQSAVIFVAAASIAYLTAVACSLRVKGAGGAALIVVFAVLLRFAAWNVSPVYTTDYYRYVWDGKVAASGINPYKYSPVANELKELRDGEMFDKINFKKVPTGYGPAAEVVFTSFYRLAGEDLQVWRKLFFLMETFVLALVFALVMQAGLPPARAAIYAYNPLVLLELCANMHVDSLMMVFLLGCFIAAFAGGKYLAALLLSAATLVKFFPALLFPAAIAFIKNRKPISAKEIFLMAIVFSAAIFAPVYFYSRAGANFLEGLKYFASGLTPTRFSPYYFIEAISGQSGGRIICAALMMVFALAAFSHRAKSNKHLYLACLLTIIVLLSPAQRPWYFVWAIPFCCVRPVFSIILMSCASLLTYGYLFSFDLIYPAKAVIYAMFYLAVSVEILYELKLKAILNNGTDRKPAP